MVFKNFFKGIYKYRRVNSWMRKIIFECFLVVLIKIREIVSKLVFLR